MCGKIVEQSWQLKQEKSFIENIGFTAEVLDKWGKEMKENFRSRMQHLKTIMQRTKGRHDEFSIHLYQDSAKKLMETYNGEEVFQRQRCKQLWLREGDSNSKFFHTATKARRKQNKISTLSNENGDLVGWDSGLEETMVNYSSNLFSATATDWSEVISCVSSCVMADHNSGLLTPVQPKEVKDALFSMHPDKSPGPDGMSPGFYQKYQKVVGVDIVQLAQVFFTSGKFENNITDTNIVLIPKKQEPLTMADPGPISLCNVVYKVVSKCWRTD